MFKKLFDSVREAVRSFKERGKAQEAIKGFEKAGKPVIKARNAMRHLRTLKVNKRDRPRRKPTAKEKAASMLAPGTFVELPSGATYKVGPAGNWLRVYLKPGEQREIRKWQDVRSTENAPKAS